MSDFLKYMGKTIILVLLGFLLLIFLCLHCGGVGISIVCIVSTIHFYWFPTRDRMGTHSEDSEKRDDTNPLYLKRRFRKRTSGRFANIFTADLKGDFLCQIYAVILIVAMALYGIYSAFHGGRNFNRAEGILVICMGTGMAVYMLVKTYYAVIFERTYVKSPWRPWNPFSFTGNKRSTAYDEKTEFTSFTDLKKEVFQSCQMHGYKLVYKREWGNDESAWIFIKNEKRTTYIFEIIRIPYMKKEDIVRLNEMFEDFLPKLYQTQKRTRSLRLIFLMCADEETRAFREIINKSVVPGIRRHRLPAGITLDNGNICTAKWDFDYEYGEWTYKKMQKEFSSIMRMKGW